MKTNDVCRMTPPKAAWAFVFVMLDPSLTECDRSRIAEWWNADQKEN